MAACKEGDQRVRGIASAIRVVPNFPKPGIMFQDITTLLLDTHAFRDTIDLFVERYMDKKISVVAGFGSTCLRDLTELHEQLQMCLEYPNMEI